MAESEGTVLLPCTLGCGAILALQASIVGARSPSVALCMPQGPTTGPIHAGSYKAWGDAATRVEYADPDDADKVVTHVIQLGVVPKVEKRVDADHFRCTFEDIGVPVQDVSAEPEEVFADFAAVPYRDPNPGGD